MFQRVPAEAGTESAVAGPDATADSLRGRVRTQQIGALDDTAPSGGANLPVAILVAFIMRANITPAWLCIWVAAMAIVVGAMVVSSRRRSPVDLSRRLALRVLFAAAIGGLWGGGALLFGPSLSQSQMMFFAVIVMSCNAACVSGLGPYLPAFFGYCIASVVPLGYVMFSRHDSPSRNLAILIALFIAVIAVNVRAYNRQVLAAYRLRAENEALAENVLRARAATAEATHSKWSTLAYLSHELRTPMNAIIGFSEMIRAQMFGPLGARYLEYSGHIHDSGLRTLAIIDSILDVSNAEVGKLALSESEIAPADLVEGCLQKIDAAARHVTIERRYRPSPPCIVVDTEKLQDAVLKLLTNAVQYTPAGGLVTVELGWADGGLDITIADTGAGIAAKDLEKCAEPFVRGGDPLIAGVSGTGLGLALAKRLIEAHGGSLRLESELCHGTTATLHLPAARCAPHATRTAKQTRFA